MGGSPDRSPHGPDSASSIISRCARSPAETAAAWPTGPVWALWADAPVPFAVREAARISARAASATVAEIVPLPTGQETSRVANAPVRLAAAATTRGAEDRVVIVPWPSGTTVPWDADGVRLRASVAAAYGATELVLAPGVGVVPGDAVIPVRTVDVPLDHATIPIDQLDELVTHGAALPPWAAEPSVAAELLLVHRPRSRSGLTVLLSGLSGSGKSTVARALAVRLMEHESRSVSLLDGDVVRHHLSKGLGFSRPDRITNVLPDRIRRGRDHQSGWGGRLLPDRPVRRDAEAGTRHGRGARNVRSGARRHAT